METPKPSEPENQQKDSQFESNLEAQSEASTSTFGGNPKLWSILAPILIFVLAILVRIPGSSWGLPNNLHNQSYHPDEEVVWIMSQQIEPAKFDFTPGQYNYGTLYLSVLRIASDMVNAYGGGPKLENPETATPEQKSKALSEYVAKCHKAGRNLNILFGALTALIITLTVARYTNAFGGAIAGLAIAFSPAFVVHSRFQTTDVLATLLLAVAFWLALMPPRTETPKLAKLFGTQTKQYIWVGLAIGLSAGTKYTGILALAPLFVLWVFSEAGFHVKSKPNDIKPYLAAVVTAFLGFIVATPGVLLDTAAFLRDFQFELLHTSTGHGLLFVNTPKFTTDLANTMQGLGLPVTLLGIIGLGWACSKRDKGALGFLVFFILYFILIGRAQVHFMRYTFPLYLACAYGLGWAAWKGHMNGGIQRLWPVLAIFGLGNTILVSSGFTANMLGTDERDRIAKKLIQETEQNPNLSVGIVSDPWYWTPPFFPNSTITRMAGPQIYLGEMSSAKVNLVRYIPDNPDERFDWDKRLLTELKPDVVVFSNFEAGPVAKLVNANLDGIPKLIVDRFKDFHAELEKEYKLENFSTSNPIGLYQATYAYVEDMQYVQPIVYVWRKKSGENTSSE